jgi:hypothetical protein
MAQSHRNLRGQSAPEPTWREQIRDLLPEITERLANACGIRALDSSKNGWAARELADQAMRLINEHDEDLRTCAPDRYNGECAYPAQAAVLGALHLPDTALGFADVLRPAADLLERVGEIADNVLEGQ